MHVSVVCVYEKEREREKEAYHYVFVSAPGCHKMGRHK